MEGSRDELMQLLPFYFRPVREFQEIMKAHGYVLDELQGFSKRISDNLYLSTCDEQTLAYYESLLGISGAGRTLEERRTIILLQWGTQTRYTLPKLRELLEAAVGAGNAVVECDYAQYRVTIVLRDQDTAVISGLYDTVFKMVPAHIVLVVGGWYPAEYDVPISWENSILFRTEFYPRYNLGYLLLDGTWLLDGSRRLNGYDSDVVLDFYPIQFEVSTQAALAPETAEGLRITAGAAAESGTLETAAFRTSASEKVEPGEILEFQAGAALQLGTECFVTQQNLLDGTWILDGSRLLDGGISEL